MPSIQRLDPNGYTRTPWKNGGGVTVEIACASAPDNESRMLWRLARTQIVEEGPFSDWSGYDRILTVIGGRGGLVLEVEGGKELDVREVFRPVRFRGEDSITARLESGPVTVLNLIADRTLHAIDAEVLTQERGTRPLSAAVSIVYAIKGGMVALGSEKYNLASDEALRIEGGGGALTVKSGRIALASINPCNGPR